MLYKCMVKLFRVIFAIIFRIELKGWDKIPIDQDTIVCSNHQSMWDPILISAYYPNQIHWMAKSELFTKEIVSKFLKKMGAFPVDREGKDIGALRHALRYLRDKETLGIFPEGTRVKNLDESQPKAGVGLMAVKTKTVVVPIHIESSFKLFAKTILTVKEPISFREQTTKTTDYEKVSKDIMERIYR